MPSVSDKQARFMRAAAHDAKFAKAAGIPQSVAKEYAAADKRNADGVRKAPSISEMAKRRYGSAE